MHCHCGTNNRAPCWTLTDPCKPKVRPGAREESASPDWIAAPAMNARDTTKVYIWRFDTGCGPTLYRKCHSHNTPVKRHNKTWVEPLAGNCTTSSTRQNYLKCHFVHERHKFIRSITDFNHMYCIIQCKNRSTEGCSKLKSPETRQVQEILVSTLEHLQVPKWDRTRCSEE